MHDHMRGFIHEGHVDKGRHMGDKGVVNIPTWNHRDKGHRYEGIDKCEKVI